MVLKAVLSVMALASFLLSKPLSANTACFDFSKRITAPLKPPVKLNGARKDASTGGKNAGGAVWGNTRGIVSAPIKSLYAKLLDHYTIKDPKKVKLRTYEQDQRGFDDFHLVMIHANPAPLITIDWEENWGYVIAEGSREQPRKVVISYEKVNGTSFIRRLCGSIVLEASSDTTTDVSLYEEVDAAGHRTTEATMKSQQGTLATLRK